MRLTRRSLLGGLSAGIAGAGLWRPAMASQNADFPNPLRIAALDEGRREAGSHVFDLAAQAGTSEFLPDKKTPTIGLNGAYLGPTLSWRAGDRVTLNVRNDLAFDTTLHWHGLHVPASMDGGPHQVIRPGATWSPGFEIKQKAGLFWYHSHMMEETGAQVNAGLAGLILVRDAESEGLGLPSEHGVDDIPLVIQDRRFHADGRFAYLTSMRDTMMGFKGDTILVNGTFAPHLVLRRRLTRLRVLNGSNARIYNLGRSDGRPLTQIGTDGSLLDRPVQRRRVRLGPGERVDIVFEAETDSTVRLVSYPDEPARGARRGGMMMGMAGNDEEFPIVELRAGTLEPSKPLPGKLIDVPAWDPRKAARTRDFELQMGMGMGMMGGGRGMGPGMRMGRGGGMGGMGMMAINGRTMDMERIDERVKLGTIEIWRIVNATPLAHTFHIHDVQFRILDRDGAPPEPHERGLKDTVLIDAGASVRVIHRFEDFADPHHPYMYHCHILEHEDAGMMGQFVVTA